MLTVLALTALEGSLNTAMDLDAATRAGFDRLAGKRIRVVVRSPNLSVDVDCDTGKIRLAPTPLQAGPASERESHRPSLFEQRPYDSQLAVQPADLTITAPNLVALTSLLLSEPGQTGNVPVEGDVSLLFAIRTLTSSMQPALAPLLMPVIGPAAAGEAQRWLKRSWTQLRSTMNNSRERLEETLTEDTGLFAPRWQVDRWSRQLRELGTEIERSEARLYRLEQQQQQQQ